VKADRHTRDIVSDSSMMAVNREIVLLSHWDKRKRSRIRHHVPETYWVDLISGVKRWEEIYELFKN
jgi:hypothetical protein